LLIALSACSSARLERPDPFPPTVITKEQLDLERHFYTLADRDFVKGSVNSIVVFYHQPTVSPLGITTLLLTDPATVHKC
jgi:hypothetical protein